MKKIFAILFILVFMLSLKAAPIHVQASTPAQSTFGYIPLVSPGGSNAMPVRERARQAFERMAGELNQAQNSGKIIRYEPEFDFGLLKVEYPKEINLTSSLSAGERILLRVFDAPKSALDYIGVKLDRQAASPTRAANDPWIDIGLGDSCFSGGDMGGNYHYRGYLWDSTGREVAYVDGYTDNDGYIDDCFSGTWSDMMPGYSFSLTVDSPNVQTFSATIPNLDITSISLSTKTIKGTAPASASLEFFLKHPYLDGPENYWQDTEMIITANSKGAWTAKLLLGAAFRGGDDVEIVMPTTQFDFYRDLRVPSIYCQLGANYCGIYGIPGKAAHLSIKHGKKTYLFSGRFNYWGYLGADVYDANGQPVFLAAGDQVSGAGVTALKLVNLTTMLDYAANTVYGVAPANRWFGVELGVLYDSDGNYVGDWNWNWVESTAAGTYTTDFSGDYDITSADLLTTSLWYVDPITGNETSLYDVLNVPETVNVP